MEKAQEITRKQLELFWHQKLQVRLVTVIRDFQKPVDFFDNISPFDLIEFST